MSSIPAATRGAAHARWLLALALCLGVVAADAPGAPIAVTRDGATYAVHFAPDQVRIEETAAGARVTLTSHPAALRVPGAPSLPLVPVVIEIPVGQTAISISVELEETTITRDLRLAPAPRPALGSEEAQIVPPREDLFADLYPPQVARLTGEGFARGRRLVTVQLAPLRWHPTTGTLRLATEIRFELELAPATDRPLPRRRTIPAAEHRFARTLAIATGAPLPTAPPPAGSAPATPFVPTFPPTTDGSPVEFVIVTGAAIEAEFQVLADWRTQTGTQAVVRTMEWIESAYANGADRAEQLRFFLQDAYQNWGTVWVLLGGDTDVIPVRYAASVVQTTPDDPAYIPSDLYYACLDGNWNGDGDDRIGEGFRSISDPGDAADLTPEVFVGRVPVSTALQAADYIQKLLDHERTPPIDPDYPASVLFLAEHLGALDGAVIAESAFALVPPWVRVVRLYENHASFPGSLPLDRPTALDSISAGFGWVHHVGHGFRNTMSVGDGSINNADTDALTNGARQSFVFAINCRSASIDFNAIGERWLKNTGGGAVGYVGSSHEAFPLVSERYQNEFYRLAFADSIATAGECLFMSRLPWIGDAFADNFDRWTQLAILLLGDPAQPLWTRTPTPLTVVHDSTLELGAGSFSVTVLNEADDPVPEARVTLWAPGEDYQTGLTDVSGQLTLGFEPNHTGTFLVTATRDNFLPSETQVEIVPAGGPFLFVSQTAVDDDSTGASIGNGDGLANPGETIELNLFLVNSGASSADTTSGTLVIEQGAEFVSLLVDEAEFGDIAPDGEQSGTFVLQLDAPLPAGQQLLCRLDVTASQGAWSDRCVLPIHAAVIEQYAHAWLDPVPGGNGNGTIEAGESIDFNVELRNIGVGEAVAVAAGLRVLNRLTGLPEPLVAASDDSAAYGTLPPAARAIGEFSFTLDPAANPAELLLELTVTDAWDTLAVQLSDLTPPAGVDSLRATGSNVAITLKWAPPDVPDLLGYDVFRADLAAGPFVRVNDQTVIGTTFFEDFPLAPLSRYYYKVVARDSSFNQSEVSTEISASTNPPLHAGWPIEIGQTTTSGIKAADLIPGDGLELVLGADYVYGWHHDGQELVDGDGDPRTSGVLTIEGGDALNGFRCDAALADLDLDGELEIIISGWGAFAAVGAVHVLAPDGTARPGWPRSLHQTYNWGSPVIGQVTADSELEVVAMQGQTGMLYAFHADGTELRDGDGDPATIGPFFDTESSYNYSSPGLADIDGDQLDEIIVVQSEAPGLVYALNHDGSAVPGWPFTTGNQITASPVFADLDESGTLEIVITSEVDSVFVLRADGSLYPGWPQPAVIGSHTGRTPSPVVADIDQNGILDILVVANDGQIHLWNRDGTRLAGWEEVLFAQSVLAAGVTEATPTVGDIDGDGQFEILIGAEDARLYAFNHDATEVFGFPIQLDGEVRGSATIADLDADGLVEIAVTAWDQNVYVWDLDAPFDAELVPWPYFRGDLLNRGHHDPPNQVGMGETVSFAPFAYRLGRARPNPFNPRTVIDLDVPRTANDAVVRLKVYDAGGRLVRTLVDGPLGGGRHTVVWDGRGLQGRALPSGVYFLRVQAPGFEAARKIMLVK